MSYTPTTWQTGDTITAAGLNKIEQGIANAGGGGLVTINEDGELDKNFNELIAMAEAGIIPCFIQEEESNTTNYYFYKLAWLYIDNGTYVAIFSTTVSSEITEFAFIASSATGTLVLD